MRFKTFLIFGFIIITLFGITACAPGNLLENHPSLEAENIQLQEIIHLTPSDPPSLDFHAGMDIISAEVTRQIFEQMLAFDENGDIIPLLAESFQMVDDLTWEFRLRQGVYFHDGAPLNSTAVAINMERILDPETASPRLFIMSMVDRVEIIDDYTLQIITHYPFVPLPNNIVHSGSLISPLAIEEERRGGRTVAENPIGTGPFRFYSRIHGEEIRLVPNENYWRQPPSVNLTFRIVPDNSTRVLMLTSGQANTMRLAGSDVESLLAMENIEINLIDSTQLIFLGFNHNVEPFNDLRVRQAITKAINKEDIVYGIVEGFGIVADGPISPSVRGSDADLDVLEFNMEEARILLEDAGFPYGFEATLLVAEGNIINGIIAEYVQANLSQIGINITIESMIWASFLEHTAAGNHQLFINGWTTTTGDADYSLFPLFHSSVPAVAGNRGFFSNETVDYLINIGRTNLDMDFRTEIYAQIQQILVDEAAKVFLYFPIIPFASYNVSNIFVDFNGLPHFFEAIVLD